MKKGWMSKKEGRRIKSRERGWKRRINEREEKGGRRDG
jgi:hypothetical protein